MLGKLMKYEFRALWRIFVPCWLAILALGFLNSLTLYQPNHNPWGAMLSAMGVFFYVLGTMAVQQQMAFFSDALGHSALTGIGLGIVLGMHDDLLSMLIFGVVWAIAISRIKQTGTTSADTIISVFSSTSIALGLVILAHGGGFAKYSTLLIGDVLAVTPQDLLYLLIALVCGVVLWAVMYNALLLTGINASLAQSRGIRTKLTEYAFAVLLAVAVMLAIRWVGVMLINALLILPAAAGRNLAKNARQHAVISVLIALICGIAGLLSAY